jgi:hypothetical protein
MAEISEIHEKKLQYETYKYFADSKWIIGSPNAAICVEKPAEILKISIG